jgi:UDP-N-acetylmuramate--alanine ligase
MGSKYFVAETDEYRRHFLSFAPKRIVLTSVESDHQDYFPDYASIRDAYLEYLRKLPNDGELIFCADDPGAKETVDLFSKERPSVKLIPYGFSAPGEWGIESFTSRSGQSIFKLRGFQKEYELRVPGRHSVLNAAAAMALTSLLVQNEYDYWNTDIDDRVRQALIEFQGSKRRSEIIGEAGGILFMDDYGHHPTAIKTTLAGLKEFYGRRLVLSFMSHTYTRTAALLDEFAASFESADILMLHKIYGSARETYSGGVTGKTLFDKTKAIMGDKVYYCEEPEAAADALKNILRAGDLFITMGAGDNWKLGQKLLALFETETEKSRL